MFIMFQLYFTYLLSAQLLAAAVPLTSDQSRQASFEWTSVIDSATRPRAGLGRPQSVSSNLPTVNKFITIGAAPTSIDNGHGGDVARSRRRDLEPASTSEPVLVRKRRRAMRRHEQRWPNAVIPYVLESSLDELSNSAKDMVRSAFEHWQLRTCIRFVPYEPLLHENWIVIGKGNWCDSIIGMIGGAQRINMAAGCLRNGTVVHELGHALGWLHEQARPDRDDHVMVRWSFVPAGSRSNYNKRDKASFDTHNLPYDHGSIMHYQGTYIVSREQSKQHLLGQRQRLSFYDMKLANLMYKCAERNGCDANKVECTDDGYVGPACKCICLDDTESCTIRKDSGTTLGTTPQTTGVIDSMCTRWNKSVEGAYIAGYNDEVISGVTVEECKLHCAMQRRFRCASIDYWMERRQCYLSSASLRMVGVELSRDAGMTYYERDPSTIRRRSSPC